MSEDDQEVFGEGSDFEVRLSLPRIVFKPISTEPDAQWFRQIAIATRRRFFSLTEDWSLELRSPRYPDLSGTIVIPRETDGELFEFDGASIPVPWLISVFTIGVLRPLGVLLIASIVHDYAFRYGLLKVRDGDGVIRDVAIKRDVADDLFRDLVSEVNGNRVVGYVAWYFVRMGYWLCVRYNGHKRTGRAPVAVLLSFIVGICGLLYLLYLFSLVEVLLSAVTLYLTVYVLTLRCLGAISRKVTVAVVAGILFIAFLAFELYYQGCFDVDRAQSCNLKSVPVLRGLLFWLPP